MAAVFVTVLALRGLFAWWAAARFPPTADGIYYERLAIRLLEGQGFTWAWPDGVVTAAAHYPVGFPAMLAGSYWLLGRSPFVALVPSVLFAATAAVTVYAAARTRTSQLRAVGSALAVTLHPALYLYTPALMTEGLTASLALMAMAFSALPTRSAFLGPAGVGVLTGLTTLVRPQSLLWAPLQGWLAANPAVKRGRKALAAALALAVALLICLPWTVRNCIEMHRCALVSMNDGWNLLIGVRHATWEPIEVPNLCREVFDEAAKNTCFARAAIGEIIQAPGAYLGRIPQKLSATFDYVGAAPWYLHESNSSLMTEHAKWWLGAIETVCVRAALCLACLTGAQIAGRAISAAGRAYALVGGLLSVSAWIPAGWIAFVGFAIYALVVGLQARDRMLAGAGVVVGTTALAHAVFFGSGRYALPAVAAVTLVGSLVELPKRSPSLTGG